MNDLVNQNAEAQRQGMEDHETRIVELENKIATLTNHVQTCVNLVTQLQTTNSLALAQLRGTGPTDGNVG